MKYLNVTFLFIGTLFIQSCKKPMDESGIEAYVIGKKSADQIYDIDVSPNYSRENELIQVVSYEQNDSIIMISQELSDNSGYAFISVFYYDFNPVYVEEYRELVNEPKLGYIERKLYVQEGSVIASYERKANSPDGLDEVNYEKASLALSTYDFERFDKALKQTGEFDMQFGEFLSLPGETYLILENYKSGYNAAYIVLKGDDFIDELYSNQEMYKGSSIFIDPEYRVIGGISRMVYTQGRFK